MQSRTREGLRIGGWALAGLVGVFVVVLLVASMAIFGWGMFQRGTADFRGETDAREQTQANGEFRRAAYRQFFDLCASIQAEEGRIDIFEDRLEAEDGTANESTARTNLDAAKANRIRLITSYNSQATQDSSYGAAQFQDSDLPYQIDPDNENTECAA